MDRAAAMQNLLFYGNNAAAMSGGVANGQVETTSNGNEDQSQQQQGNTGAGLQQAGYGAQPLLGMQGYFAQQGQAAAAAHAAAAMAEQRMADGNGTGAGATTQGGGYAPPAESYANMGMMYGAAAAPNGGAGGQQQGGADYMNANHLLMQSLQGQQQQQAAATAGGAPLVWMANYGYVPQQQPQQQPPVENNGGVTPQHQIDAMNYAQNGILGPWSATSAGLLGNIAPVGDDKKKTVRRKHKDKPKRPLSAYNIFFKEERARILEAIPSKKEEGEAEEKDETTPASEGDDKDKSNDNEDQSAADGDNSEKKNDTKKNGRKRKKTPHGKIGFESLAKMIGKRWKELKPDKADYYKSLAAEDMKRYKEQMETFLIKQEEETKRSLGIITTEDEQVVKNSEGEIYQEGENPGEEGPAAKKVKATEAFLI